MYALVKAANDEICIDMMCNSTIEARNGSYELKYKRATSSSGVLLDLLEQYHHCLLINDVLIQYQGYLK
jgi:hypothetical protein